MDIHRVITFNLEYNLNWKKKRKKVMDVALSSKNFYFYNQKNYDFQAVNFLSGSDISNHKFSIFETQ
jgi:hypothetical protein